VCIPKIGGLGRAAKGPGKDRRGTLAGVRHALRPDGETWLRNLDERREDALAVFADANNGAAKARVEAWGGFFIACAELFAFRGGNEWMVSHYLLKRRAAQAART
jgi:hypothetical protein